MTDHIPDTVENAAATPEKDQPYHLLGLKPDEYQRILQIIGRAPTFTELGIFSAMWNEHCSYKSSKKWLRTLPTTGLVLHLRHARGRTRAVFEEGW